MWILWSDTQLYYFGFTANTIRATSAWEYVANTQFLLNKSTPYHALKNYLMLFVYFMVSIEKNSEIVNILGASWARLTVAVWNCPGRDRVCGLMSVHELPSNEYSTSFLKYYSVKWSSQTIFRLKISRSTLWPVSMNHRSNSVKPLNGFTLFWWAAPFSQGISWHSLFGRSFFPFDAPSPALFIHP